MNEISKNSYKIDIIIMNYNLIKKKINYRAKKYYFIINNF